MNLNGRHALVTGGAVRVGAALVRSLAAAGARVTVHCRESRSEAEKLVSELPGADHRVAVADFSSGETGAAELWAQLDAPVDVLVGNASCYRLTAGLERLYDLVNCRAPLELMRRFAAQDIAAGSVVNVLDQAVLNPAPAEAEAYLESRRGLAAATREFARRFAGKNLRFNAVAPGPMLPPRGLENSRMEKTLRQVPLGRPVAVADLVKAVLFLIGNDSVTGAILPVDCGMSLPPLPPTGEQS